MRSNEPQLATRGLYPNNERETIQTSPEHILHPKALIRLPASLCKPSLRTYFDWDDSGNTDYAARPAILDIFAGSGGCSIGYHLAGFRCYGIDSDPKPLRHYPFPYICMDALEAMDRLLNGEGLTFSNGETLYLVDFAAFHSSPECKGYSALAGMHPGREWQLLIGETRERLIATGKPYVLENVETAPVNKKPDLFGGFGVMLCGSMFGLGIERGYLRRHRLFETNFPVPQLDCRHRGVAVGVYGHGGHTKKHRMLYRQEASEAMGIDWMSRDEMCQAMPPVYLEYIGKYLIKAVNCEADCGT